MIDDIGNNDEIIAYLRQTMSEPERQAFEKRLSEESQLREELEEIRELDTGLRWLAETTGDHPDSILLAEYAEDPDSLSDQSRREIETHLVKCPDCREEVDLSKLALSRALGRTQTAKEPVWKRLVDRLVIRPVVLRPVYALAATLLLVAVGFFAGGGLQQPGEVTQMFTLVDSGVRGAADVNVVSIRESTEVVELEFSEPVRLDRVYDFELYDINGRLLLAAPGNLARKPFVFEIPASYLDAGEHTLKVIEKDVNGNVHHKSSIPFEVVIER
jgi:hypothetical protein